MISGKFERNAASHLACQIKQHEDAERAQYADEAPHLMPRLRTPEEIMIETLTRLDIDTTPELVARYVRYWVADARTINELVKDLRK